MEAPAATSDRFSRTLWGLALVAVGVWLPGRFLPAVVGVMAMVECTRSYARAGRVLPDRVASHFNFALRPDGWSSRRTYLTLMGGMTFLFMIALPLGFLLLPVAQANVKAQRLTLWAITLSASMMTGVNELVVRANLSDPIEMPVTMWALLGLFMVAINCWGLAPLLPW
jgi:hypothetical protein